ncbi:hypothetical protein Bbelb_435300 [Branchiostoma belcheri]|nr:hypothetical protein Bbelb_435300 [Branchiostoma belcheri]
MKVTQSDRSPSVSAMFIFPCLTRGKSAWLPPQTATHTGACVFRKTSRGDTADKITEYREESGSSTLTTGPTGLQRHYVDLCVKCDGCRAGLRSIRHAGDGGADGGEPDCWCRENERCFHPGSTQWQLDCCLSKWNHFA